MITKFNNYIVESRKSIDELEMLNPEELRGLLLDELWKVSFDSQYIQDLLDVGCPIDARDNYGRTALHWAVINEDLRVVKFLLSKGADINARSNSGRTPLHLAANNMGIVWILEFLISKGADIHARTNDDQTAWDIASTKTREAVPELNPNK